MWQLLVDLEIVPEVGRLAGGFQAFKELNAAVTSVADSWSHHCSWPDQFDAGMQGVCLCGGAGEGMGAGGGRDKV